MSSIWSGSENELKQTAKNTVYFRPLLCFRLHPSERIEWSYKDWKKKKWRHRNLISLFGWFYLSRAKILLSLLLFWFWISFLKSSGNLFVAMSWGQEIVRWSSGKVWNCWTSPTQAKTTLNEQRRRLVESKLLTMHSKFAVNESERSLYYCNSYRTERNGVARTQRNCAEVSRTNCTNIQNRIILEKWDQKRHKYYRKV